MPLTGLVDLVNGWGSTARLEAGEQDWPPAAAPHRPARFTEDVLAFVTDEELTRTADRLHPVFATTDLRQRVQLVSRLLAETGVRPALLEDNDGARGIWQVDDTRWAPRRGGGRTACASRRTTGDCPGVCRRCADVYIDASPARTDVSAR